MNFYRLNLATAVICIVSCCLVCDANAQFDIDWFTIDGGGGFSSGSGFELEGTIGQFDAGAIMSGGSFTLTGGFQVGGESAKVLLGDINCDGVINLLDVAPFIDAISTGTFSEKADVNQDGTVNLLDVAPFIDLLSSG